MDAQPGFYARAKARFPFLPKELLQVFTRAWIETGNVNVALATMREDSRYDTYFGGNRRDDGTFRLSERQYHANKIKYDQVLASFGLPTNSKFFQDKFAELVAGEKSMSQFESDMARLYVGIATNTRQIREFYQSNFGEGRNLSTAAIFASALDTSKSPLVYEQEIRMAQIGGTAKAHSFDLNLVEVQRLAAYGLEGEAANTLFSTAAQSIPSLQEMVIRHNDPDDEFNINDYTNALVVKDANDLRRLTRLVGAEESLFRTGSSVRTDELGRLTGLSA